MYHRLAISTTTRLFGLTLALASLLVVCNPAAAVITVSNNSFETFSGASQGFTPSQGPVSIGSWTYDLSGATQGPTADGAYEGISINLATMTAAPNGSVAAFIEGKGTLSQSLSGFQSSPYTYTVSFYGESYSGGGEALQLLIDSTVLTFNSGAANTLTPSSSSGGHFTLYTTDPFTVSAGSHTLTFNGTTTDLPGGHIAFIDEVNVNEIAPAPEPASLGLLAASGLLLLRRRGRR